MIPFQKLSWSVGLVFGEAAVGIKEVKNKSNYSVYYNWKQVGQVIVGNKW